MAQTNREVVRRWLNDSTNGGLTMRGGRPYGYAAESVRCNDDGQLIYHRKARRDRSLPAWGPVVLATWAPDSRTVVLNGDGFTDRRATQWQTEVRSRLFDVLLFGQPDRWGRVQERRLFPDTRIAAGTRYVIVPYMAITAAGISPTSVRPIDVQDDRWENIWHSTDEPPPFEKFNVTTENHNRRELECTVNGVRWQTFEQLNRRWKHKKSGELVQHPPYGSRDQYEMVEIWEHLSNQHNAHLSGQREAAGWKGITQGRGPLGNRVAEGWGWMESIHHLGASVFSAVDSSGKRSRFISAFDEDEPSAMYYLAQLPNRGKITTYDDAIAALAPPLVHQARQQGVPIRRQGDVFAIETDKTDEWMHANARTMVRREVATHDPTRQGITPPVLNEWDYTERGDCPCCGHRARIGWGPRCRRALMIYGTTHTATEVAVVPGGAVYIKGTMFHDPHLETPGRRPEHVTVNLGEGDRWWLAVRNTVPRRRGTTTDSNQPEEAATA